MVDLLVLLILALMSVQPAAWYMESFPESKVGRKVFSHERASQTGLSPEFESDCSTDT